MTPHIYVAIPAMQESAYLPFTLQDLFAQSYQHAFDILICVNQSEEFWENPEKYPICADNQSLLQYLDHLEPKSDVTMTVIDKSSRGQGWRGKNFGVGWARKLLFEHILAVAHPEDIIISLDADTRISKNYLQSIADNFRENPALPAIAVPYYHQLAGQDEAQDRAILRYEFYMRNYAINLLRIHSPYGFTAIGSAIAMKAGALRKIGNITPLKSGEDFYLVQKLRKMARISNYNAETVYPAARLSDRVVFGTGPAVQQGCAGNWSSYPIYHHDLFCGIQEAYRKIPELFIADIPSTEEDFLHFIQVQTSDDSPWQTIRNNVKDLPHFEQAFHEKADGLRILQYVRYLHKKNAVTDKQALYDNVMHWQLDADYRLAEEIMERFAQSVSFEQLSLKELEIIRNWLYDYEMKLRKAE